MAEASRMYEKELAQGAIKNLFRGGMVRLLLIQVQQLKTGLLQAMGSIDDLMLMMKTTIKQRQKQQWRFLMISIAIYKQIEARP